MHKILPPAYLIVAIVMMVLIRWFFPVVEIVPSQYRLLGIFVLTLGFGLVVHAAGLFRRADTPIKPFTQSTALVDSGPYRFTRNPMYVGMVIALLGLAIEVGYLPAFFVVVAFWAIINFVFIPREEKLLEATFGQSYVDFKSRVRRWI